MLRMGSTELNVIGTHGRGCLEVSDDTLSLEYSQGREGTTDFEKGFIMAKVM